MMANFFIVLKDKRKFYTPANTMNELKMMGLLAVLYW